jgi:uncharacterized protein YlxW (UPF0749 family)
LTENALDPDYELHAHSQLSRERVAKENSLRGRLIAGAVLIVAAALVVGGAMGLERANSGVRSQAEQLRTKAQLGLVATDDKSAQVQELRSSIQGLSDTNSLAAPESASVASAVGVAPLEGPGLSVTLSDATQNSGRSASDTQLGKVLDVDVQSVVNALWSAGAQGIAVNGQRITSLSAIRSAGDAILVNYRPLNPPYVVEAVGNSQQMLSRFGDSGVAQDLRTAVQNYGLGLTTSTIDSVRLNPANAVLRYATPVPGSETNS